MFHFFLKISKHAFKETPIALELATLSQVGSQPAVLFKFELSSDAEMKRMKRRPCISEQILADNGTGYFLVVSNFLFLFWFWSHQIYLLQQMCSS
ncbi:hypothetical protein BASA83_004070 [Batrachochytrium salamandrivorans]|nr:hypothetical protein BASA83_004070 [Batrachochytrium salamandrivorans]